MNKIFNIFDIVGLTKTSFSTGKTWYVRPSGGSYGAADGTTYATAWDGFTNIDWTAAGVQPGDTLFIAGTHTELLTVGGSGTIGSIITIRGDYPADAGVIDAEDTRNQGISNVSKNYITFTSISSIDAVVSCLSIEGTSTGIVTNSCTFSGSGNQGIQHLATVSATHNDVTCSGNADDGISGHDSATITVNGGTISGNDQGINVIADVVCTITGGVTFTSNVSYDLFVTAATGDETAIINITGSTLPVKTECRNGGKLILDTCVISGALNVGVTGNGFLEGTDCTFSGAVRYYDNADVDIDNCDHTSTLTVDSLAVIVMVNSAITPLILAFDLTATNCVFDNIEFRAGGTNVLTQCLIKALNTAYFGTVTLNKCYVTDNASISGALTVNHSLFDGTGTSDHILDVVSGGSLTIANSIFRDIITTKFGVAFRTGSSGVVNGCNFWDVGKVGKGIFTQVSLTASNCIFENLATGIHQTAGTVVSDNSVFYDNTANTAGTVTQNSSQTGDPLFTNAAANDFSLGVGSSGLTNGKTLGASFDDGIDTAVWGNGTSETPVVTTLQQTGSWDIGAHAS